MRDSIPTCYRVPVREFITPSRLWQAIKSDPNVAIATVFFIGVAFVLTLKLTSDYRKKEKEEKERREMERRLQARQRDEERRRKREREEQERAEQIEALLQRDPLREIDHMSGTEFEHFMADIFAKQGFPVQLTPDSGDQGVDLLLTIAGSRVAVQLKRHTRPIGNAAIQQVFTGMIHYKAKEAYVITNSTFTKSAIELARSTGVRLIDRGELKDWLSDLREEA